MDKDKMMELDRIVFEWWYNTDGVSISDICEHFSEVSMTHGVCAVNFRKLAEGRHGKTEET